MDSTFACLSFGLLDANTQSDFVLGSGFTINFEGCPFFGDNGLGTGEDVPFQK